MPDSDIGQIYSITSSTVASSCAGTSRPSALAVCMLMTNSSQVSSRTRGPEVAANGAAPAPVGGQWGAGRGKPGPGRAGAMGHGQAQFPVKEPFFIDGKLIAMGGRQPAQLPRPQLGAKVTRRPASATPVRRISHRAGNSALPPAASQRAAVRSARVRPSSKPKAFNFFIIPCSSPRVTCAPSPKKIA